MKQINNKGQKLSSALLERKKRIWQQHIINNIRNVWTDEDMTTFLEKVHKTHINATLDRKQQQNVMMFQELPSLMRLLLCACSGIVTSH